jgi:hypothetical protein
MIIILIVVAFMETKMNVPPQTPIVNFPFYRRMLYALTIELVNAAGTNLTSKYDLISLIPTWDWLVIPPPPLRPDKVIPENYAFYCSHIW